MNYCEAFDDLSWCDEHNSFWHAMNDSCDRVLFED